MHKSRCAGVPVCCRRFDNLTGHSMGCLEEREARVVVKWWERGKAFSNARALQCTSLHLNSSHFHPSLYSFPSPIYLLFLFPKLNKYIYNSNQQAVLTVVHLHFYE